MLPITLGRTLIASVLIGLLGLYATVINTHDEPEATMRISPERKLLNPDETLTVTVDVTSRVPVNAFSGKLLFDPTAFTVTEISYNTSIADLWVEEPWFSAGEGSITFAGGTTLPGGFTGEGTLLTVSLTPLRETESELALFDAHIYEHDGFGSKATVAEPIDALFTVTALTEQVRTAVAIETISESIQVLPLAVSFDLNNDGVVTFGDVSIFMLQIFGTDSRYDFNRDGVVDRTDLGLLLEARS